MNVGSRAARNGVPVQRACDSWAEQIIHQGHSVAQKPAMVMAELAFSRSSSGEAGLEDRCGALLAWLLPFRFE